MEPRQSQAGSHDHQLEHEPKRRCFFFFFSVLLGLAHSSKRQRFGFHSGSRLSIMDAAFWACCCFIPSSWQRFGFFLFSSIHHGCSVLDFNLVLFHHHGCSVLDFILVLFHHGCSSGLDLLAAFLLLDQRWRWDRSCTGTAKARFGLGEIPWR